MSHSPATRVCNGTPSQAPPRPVLRAVPAPVPDVSEILGDAAAKALDLLSADAALVLTGDGPGAGLHLSAHAGISAEAASSLGTRIGSALARRAVREQSPMRSVDVAGEERSQPDPDKSTGIASVIVVPLRGTGGVLAVGSRGQRTFGTSETTVLGLVADNAAAAMENVRLQADHGTFAEQLQRTNAVMMQVRHAREQLVRASLSGGHLDEVVVVLSRLVAAPVVVANTLGAPMASAAPNGQDALALWEARHADPSFQRALAELADGDHTAPAQMPITEDTPAWRMWRVATGSDGLAVLTVLDASGLSEVDVAVLEEGAAVVAAELMRGRSVLDAEVRLHGGLLEALMSAGSSATVETRASLLGIDLSAPQCVVAVARDDARGLSLRVAVAAGQRACARIGLRGVFAQLDDAIVALLVAADRCVSRELIERWTEAFKAELDQRNVALDGAVGVSCVPSNSGSLPDAVTGARQARRVGETCRPGQITFLEDVELLAVFADSMKHEQLERYIEGCIGKLAAYDARTNSQLVRTLEVYLDHSCVARHAAAALFLHPHSLRYRLRRIEEVQGLDLQDPFARLTAHLATKVRPLCEVPAVAG